METMFLRCSKRKLQVHFENPNYISCFCYAREDSTRNYPDSKSLTMNNIIYICIGLLYEQVFPVLNRIKTLWEIHVNIMQRWVKHFLLIGFCNHFHIFKEKEGDQQQVRILIKFQWRKWNQIVSIRSKSCEMKCHFRPLTCAADKKIDAKNTEQTQISCIFLCVRDQIIFLFLSRLSGNNRWSITFLEKGLICHLNIKIKTRQGTLSETRKCKYVFYFAHLPIKNLN